MRKVQVGQMLIKRYVILTSRGSQSSLRIIPRHDCESQCWSAITCRGMVCGGKLLRELFVLKDLFSRLIQFLEIPAGSPTPSTRRESSQGNEAPLGQHSRRNDQCQSIHAVWYELSEERRMGSSENRNSKLDARQSLSTSPFSVRLGWKVLIPGLTQM